MFLETKRLVIRSMKLSDTEDIIKMSTENGFDIIFGESQNYSEWLPDWIQESIELDIANDPFHDYLAYVIVEKISENLIGIIGCSSYKDINKIGIAYFIKEEYRKMGFASEASKSYSIYFLENYAVDEVIATVRVENIMSQKVVEKSGYTFMHTRMYQDVHDNKPEKYNFYSCKL